MFNELWSTIIETTNEETQKIKRNNLTVRGKEYNDWTICFVL